MRIIATLLCFGTKVVQAYGYSKYRVIGSPATTVKHLDKWGVDEIVLLQIDGSFDNLLLNLESISTVSTTPIAAGGGIDSLLKAEKVIQSGADRLCMQSIIHSNFQDLVRCAKIFGGQSITLKFDFSASFANLRSFDCCWGFFMTHWWPKVVDLKQYDIEEIFFNSVDADGIIQTPDFRLMANDRFSDFSVILGGGISEQNINSLSRHLSSSFKSLSFSLSNYIYQKEIANLNIIQSLLNTNISHRFMES